MNCLLYFGCALPKLFIITEYVVEISGRGSAFFFSRNADTDLEPSVRGGRQVILPTIADRINSMILSATVFRHHSASNKCI